MKKKLLILNDVDPGDSIGGQATFLRNVIPYLEVPYQLRLLTLPRSLISINWIPRRLMYLSYVLIKFPAIRSADIIFSNTPESAFIASYFNGKKLFHVFHGNNNPVTISKFRYGKYFRWVFDFFDRSILRKAKLCYTVGEDRMGAKYLRQPIDAGFLNGIHAVKGERKNFLFVGRLEAVKQVDKILLAFKTYLKHHDTGDKLIICGVGALEGYYKSLAGAQGLLDYVEFRGMTPYDQVISLMKSAKVLLLASLYEGFPMVIAEALCCGTPVLSTNVGAVGKVLQDGVNGIVLPVDFTDASFSDAIHTINSNLSYYVEEAQKSAVVFNAKSLVNEVLLSDFEG